MRLPLGSREGASAGQGVFVTRHALRLTPEYLRFLFISLKEIRKKKTSEATSCLPEFKEWQCFRDNMGLRNSRRMSEELWWWYIYIAPCGFAEHFPTAVWLDFSQYAAREGERGRCLWLSLFDERQSWASGTQGAQLVLGRPGSWPLFTWLPHQRSSVTSVHCSALFTFADCHYLSSSTWLHVHVAHMLVSTKTLVKRAEKGTQEPFLKVWKI